jgi:chemotaxis protein MotA
MDIATILGFCVAIGTVGFLALSGGNAEMYVSEHGMIVIGGGVMAATLIRFELKTVMTGLVVGAKFAFGHSRMGPRELIEKIAEMADIVRKKGPIALEAVEVDDELLAKGVRMIADGYDSSFIRDVMERERDLNATRLEEGVKVYKAIGDCAPAFGMIGTIMGMVQMFANMTDPSKLGPYMATALLATLYGAVVANFITLPIAEKLELKLHHDEITETLIIDGILQMRENKSPALIREMLVAYLPHKNRTEPDEDEAEQAA